MSRTDTEQLVVTLEARVNDFQRQMQRAQRAANQNFGGMERRAQQAGKRMEQSMESSAQKISSAFRAFGKGALGGVVGALAVNGLEQTVGRIREITRGVANIGNEAKRAGVSTKFFQELSHVAAQTRIPIDALVDGLKEMNLRGDEFALTGKGSGADAFARLGYSAQDLARKLKSPSALFLEIVGRIEKLDRAGQIRVADEVFGGTGGERFVELLDKGEAGIRQMIDEAHSFGLVMDDAMIKKADEVDRKFNLIAQTVDTKLKTAVVSAVEALDDFLDNWREVEDQGTNTLKTRLEDVNAEIAQITDHIAELKRQDADPLSFFNNGNEIAISRARLQELTAEVARLQQILQKRGEFPGAAEQAGEQSADATPKVNGLGSALSGMNSAGNAAASGLTTFADAIRALKNEIPGLTDQLAELDARNRIDGAYQAALSHARTEADVTLAEDMRRNALASLSSKPARDAASKGMLDLIGYAEGTDKGRGYNETLGYGKFTGGNRNLTLMTLDEIDAMQTQMLRHPDNNFNSSAAGRYQIVQKTLRGLRKELGLTGSEYFDAGMQDRLAEQLIRRRQGQGVAGYRNEWEGLRKIDGGMIQSALDGTTVAMPAIDPGLAQQRQQKSDEAKRQSDAYGQIIADAQQFRSEMGLEQQTLGMATEAAARLRFEQQLLNDAQRAGITLSPEQRQELSSLAAEMAKVEAATAKAADSQAQMQELQGFLGQQVQGVFSGLLSGAMTVEDALQRVIASLAEAALQAALFGNGPLGGLFGGGAGLLGAVFGLKSGGPVAGYASGGHVRGPGTGRSDSIPAMLSNGEYVINARSTAKHRALLDAINSGTLPAFADGGPVGRARQTGSTGATASAGQNITIAPVINVSANGGTQEQNADLARQTAKAAENSIRAIVQQELRTSTRPGGAYARF